MNTPPLFPPAPTLVSLLAALVLLTSLLPQSAFAAEAREGTKPTQGKNTADRLGEMVTIPAGPFLMGNHGHEGFEGPEELPQHSVNLPAYQIGKYEATRGEFRKFIEAGGYTNSSYWSAAGWKWKESDVIDYAGMHGAVTHTVRPNREQPRNAPEHWTAEQEWIGHGFGHPRFIQTDRHPVVGVTYYEAEAYCKWVADEARSYPGSARPFHHRGYYFVKGGCWDDGPFSVRCAYRGWYLPPSSSGTGPGDSDYIGFRVARSVSASSSP